MLIPAGLTELEAASGIVLDTTGRPARPAGPRLSARAALEEALLGALQRAPCAVSFSGGRDSSLLLAFAVAVARRYELPDPVAVTLRYPGDAASDEVAWQERVVTHLHLDGWERLDMTDELDFVGPVAQAELRREGNPLFPANAHTVAPVAELVRGGAVVVGVGGDELLERQSWHALADVLAGRRRAQTRDLARALVAVTPPAIRGRLRAGRAELPQQLTWLTPAARRQLVRRFGRAFDEPVRIDRAIRFAAVQRYLAIGTATLRRIAAARETELCLPLLDPVFVDALARAAGRTGWADRGTAMRALAGDLLPPEILARQSKAAFNSAFYAAATRDFVAKWSGGGLDPALVDGEALRDVWASSWPDFRAAMLLQAAWLHDFAPEACPAGETEAK